MTIASFCRQQLFEDGPLTLEELTERVVAQGLTKAMNPQSSVQSSMSSREVRLPDGRFATPLQLLQGRWLTTRRLTDQVTVWDDDGLFEEEPFHREAPLQQAHPREDLAPLLRLLRGGNLATESGGWVRKGRYYELWEASKGWPSVVPRQGQLLGFRVTGRVLEVAIIDDTAELRMRGAALSAALGPVAEPTWSYRETPDVTGRLWPLLLEDPDLLTKPASPFSSCLPDLADAIRDRDRRREEQQRFWRPDLVLPGSLQAKAAEAAYYSNMPLADWLTAFMTEAFLQLPEPGRVAGVSYPAWGGR